MIKARFIIAGVFCLSWSVYAQQHRGSAVVHTMTGCLDERPGPHYVLRDERQLRLIAQLSAHGSPVQSFAKYLGHKVEVSGAATPAESAGGAPRIEVRKIRSISDTCAAGAGETVLSSFKGDSQGAVTKNQTASGCVDEEPGPQYVLRSPGDLRIIVELEPNGFKTQALARYLGHKVRVQGSSYGRNGRRVLKVERIDDESAICSSEPSSKSTRK